MAPQAMRAIRVSGYGGPEQLKLERIERPQPQAGEVLLRVYATGVNPIDWKIRQGLLKEFMPMTFPYTPGIEVAGVVEEIGPGVTTFGIGQAVFGQTAQGGYAEYVVAPAHALTLKPQALSFAEAATIPVGATTVWRALFEYGGLTPEQRVLIVGAVMDAAGLCSRFAEMKERTRL